MVTSIENKDEWFHSWFDSPYYHMLYRHRDESEARIFLDNLLEVIQLPAGSSILDLACGKGRHSTYLHTKGYDVTGIDLSTESIKIAKNSVDDGLNFHVQDMRTFTVEKRYSAIVNLFTSFGYFSSPADNQRVLDRVKMHLLPDGLFVLDYFNSSLVSCNMSLPLLRSFDGIQFEVTKSIVNNQVIKCILVNDNGNRFQFEEKVQLFDLSELRKMISMSGMTVEKIYGNYELQPYDPNNSERMIIIASN